MEEQKCIFVNTDSGAANKYIAIAEFFYKSFPYEKIYYGLVDFDAHPLKNPTIRIQDPCTVKDIKYNASIRVQQVHISAKEGTHFDTSTTFSVSIQKGFDIDVEKKQAYLTAVVAIKCDSKKPALAQCASVNLRHPEKFAEAANNPLKLKDCLMRLYGADVANREIPLYSIILGKDEKDWYKQGLEGAFAAYYNARGETYVEEQKSAWALLKQLQKSVVQIIKPKT